MNAEIIGVGTELLLGQIANTNARDISQVLAEIGVNVYFHTVVGDNLDRMTETLRTALERSDCVIVTGGLGPTPDDVTREGVGAATGRRLIRDPSLVERIRAIFENLRREMPEENLRQADVPEGAVVIEPEGTAPGFYLQERDSVLFALPGVPWEMKAMLNKVVVPYLRDKRTGGAIVSRQVLVIGLGESHTYKKISDLVDSQDNPTIAFLAGGGQVRIRLTARAEDHDSAVALIEPIERKVRERLGKAAVHGNHESIAQALTDLLRSTKQKMAAAESLTGGLVGAAMTKAAGASDVFVGSLVCYDDRAKQNVARVPQEVLEGPGPVSDAAAAALAEGAAEVLAVDLGVSTTGVAGPDPHDDEPVGTIFVGAHHSGRTEVRKIRGYGDRDNIQAIAVTAALDLGRRLIESND
ncbi:MAG: competence/damage-inducible protein A [Actinomycetota bacterium]|nr:competence/damage-inducible protein A [Actinomycetota bacterium]